MLPIKIIFKNIGKTLDANSPALLTAIGITGTLSTAVLTVRASFKAYEIIDLAEHKNAGVGYQRLPLKGRALLVWKEYIPAAATAAVTIGCIVGANSISTKRQTALAAAFSLTEHAFSEYKDEVLEQLGKNKEEKVREGVARKHVERVASDTPITETASGESLCYDPLSGRPFTSNHESLRKAMNDVNYTITHEGYASLNDFYYALGLPHVAIGNELGWNNDHLIDLQFTSHLDDKMRPVLHVGHGVLPQSKYARNF